MVTIGACGAWTFKPSWLDGWTLWRAPLQTTSILDAFGFKQALTETCFFATLWIKALNPSLLLKTVLCSIFCERWFRFACFFKAFLGKAERLSKFSVWFTLYETVGTWKDCNPKKKVSFPLSMIHGRKCWCFRNPVKTTSDTNKHHQTPVFFLADSPHLNGSSPGFLHHRSTVTVTRWWFQIFCYFHPEPWGNDPIWRTYFSNGLKPPTRLVSGRGVHDFRVVCYASVFPAFERPRLRLTWVAGTQQVPCHWGEGKRSRFWKGPKISRNGKVMGKRGHQTKITIVF